MNDKEALRLIAFDLAKFNKTKCKRVTVALIISVAFNIFLVGSACHDYRYIKHYDYGDMPTIETYMPVVVGVATSKPSAHILTRQKLKNIYEVETFEQLLEKCALSENEKFMLREHYLKQKSFQTIAMEMNYSPDRLRHIHQDILKKINKLL